MELEKSLNEYLEKIEKYLKPLIVSERVDIVKEIKSEMLELQASGTSTEQIIERLGNPKELARAYLGEAVAKNNGFNWRRLSAVIAFYSLAGIGGMFVLPITSICGITGAWFIALMATNIFAIQEKNHLDRLYGSVCVSLNEVVLGRYTFVFLNYFTSMVVIIILYLGFVLCRKATFDVPDIILGLGLSFLVFSTITGIQMPLFFKMGYTKAKLWSVIPFAVVMLLVVLPSFVSALSGILDFAQSHKELFAFACILTSCIIQFVSYHIAVIFYRKQR